MKISSPDSILPGTFAHKPDAVDLTNLAEFKRAMSDGAHRLSLPKKATDAGKEKTEAALISTQLKQKDQRTTPLPTHTQEGVSQTITQPKLESETPKQPKPKPETLKQPKPEPETLKQPKPEPETLKQPKPEPETLKQPKFELQDITQLGQGISIHLNLQTGILNPINTKHTTPGAIIKEVKTVLVLDSQRIGEKSVEPLLANVIGTGAGSSDGQHDQGREHPDQATNLLDLADSKPVSPILLNTPGDRLLAALQGNSAPSPATRDIGQLLDALQVHLHTGTTRNKDAALLQVTLPNLGTVAIQITHTLGQLQVDIQANPGSLLQLQQARSELMERLQKLHPEASITLSFGDSQNDDQGSRQRRHVNEEWEPEV